MKKILFILFFCASYVSFSQMNVVVINNTPVDFEFSFDIKDYNCTSISSTPLISNGGSTTNISTGSGASFYLDAIVKPLNCELIDWMGISRNTTINNCQSCSAAYTYLLSIPVTEECRINRAITIEWSYCDEYDTGLGESSVVNIY